MKQFEKNLKLIQSNIQNLTRSVNKSKLNISDDEIYFLKAKGLIETSRDYENDLRIMLSDSGITYFDDKRESRIKMLISWSINFAVAVLSAAFGSGLTLLIQFLIQNLAEK
ncbi:MAG: hypothetical protein ACI4S2_12535 [Lachnospiraceae bacterium]